MRKLMTLATIWVPTMLFAGNGGAGGGPPAVQEEMAMLMSSKQDLALIRDEDDSSLLLSRAMLPESFTLTSGTSLINTAGVELKAGQNIDSVEGKDLIRKSYKVRDGDRLGTVELVDRLSAIRAGTQTNIAQ